MSGNRVHVTGSGLSFELPEENWSPNSSKHQSQGSMELLSFTRTNPILLENELAYYPTISIIIETLEQESDAVTYDKSVISEVENAGMVVEVVESLPPGGDILPELDAVGSKVLVHTQQGDSLGYMINTVRGQTGIRFLLESSPKNFEDVNSEFIEIVKSIKVEE
jgi:hypothetical protein